jgi:branched-chain amino acid transport system substrate-binding protein
MIGKCRYDAAAPPGERQRESTMKTSGWVLPSAAIAFAIVAITAGPAAAQQRHDRSADDREIRIGNTMPYTGPAAAYGAIGKTIAAYFEKVNAEGGVNGRKLRFISYDDACNAQKTVELVRKLVEEDRVLFTFATLGTAMNAAIRQYMNANKVPQLFVASGATMWDSPKEFPWTMGWQPSGTCDGRRASRDHGDILKRFPIDLVRATHQEFRP